MLNVTSFVNKRNKATGWPPHRQYYLYIDPHPTMHYAAWRKLLDVSLYGCRTGSKEKDSRTCYLFESYGSMIKTVRLILTRFPGTLHSYDECFLFTLTKK